MTEPTKPEPRRSPALLRALWFGPRLTEVKAQIEKERRTEMIARAMRIAELRDPLSYGWKYEGNGCIKVWTDDGEFLFAITMSNSKVVALLRAPWSRTQRG